MLDQKIQDLTSTISDIRTSINNKGVAVAPSDGFKYYPDAVNLINFPELGAELNPTIHGVNYYDYDGTLLYVFSPSEFLELTEHPLQPTYSGLISQGWNWDLTEAKNFIQNSCDCLNIGALYITDDGKTRLYIDIPEVVEETSTKTNINIDWNLYYHQTKAYGFTIDWGDGTTSTSQTGNSGAKNTSHNYAHAGKYIITIDPDDDCNVTLGASTAYTNVFGYSLNSQRWKASCLYKVELGKNINFNQGKAFVRCENLETVTMPRNLSGTVIGTETFGVLTTSLKAIILPPGITTINSNAFTATSSCKCICIPNGVTSITNGACTAIIDSFIVPDTCTTFSGQMFDGNENVRRIYVPDSVTNTFTNYVFRYTYNLQELHVPNNSAITTFAQYTLADTGLTCIEIPEYITNIGNQALYSKCLMIVIMRPTTPPTLATINIFNPNTNLKIYVPYSSDHSILEAYQTAAKWSNHASKIYELDENGNIPSE